MVCIEHLLVSLEPEQIGLDFGVLRLLLILLNILGEPMGEESASHGAPAMPLQPITQSGKTTSLSVDGVRLNPACRLFRCSPHVDESRVCGIGSQAVAAGRQDVSGLNIPKFV
ncbi:hypothetical protein MEA186_28962 [Mesorhizobium amorphae CCNWGS0123]|uniref:Uncharacterized protein n=1 Tax=Mesorhizobium amorphae CCNWGS0123 TaxID=1082933 RepID=G6YIH0_9HYPH|nr:hypothetical protein A6B35_32920 [Mesorhizobium amorphae CCNWGS0123]EHH06267.1 hypothetical protein MEA186_28962 [Mesorhizobium amorphae CCNWGS0123]